MHELERYERTLAVHVNFGSQIFGCVGLVVPVDGFVVGEVAGEVFIDEGENMFGTGFCTEDG